jgi:hypothetical protein
LFQLMLLFQNKREESEIQIHDKNVSSVTRTGI